MPSARPSDAASQLDSPPSCMVHLEPLNRSPGGRHAGHARTASVHSEQDLLQARRNRLDGHWDALFSPQQSPASFPGRSPGGMPTMPSGSHEALRRLDSFHRGLAGSASGPLLRHNSHRNRHSTSSSATPSGASDHADGAGAAVGPKPVNDRVPAGARGLITATDVAHPLVKVVGGRPCILLPHLSPRHES